MATTVAEAEIQAPESARSFFSAWHQMILMLMGDILHLPSFKYWIVAHSFLHPSPKGPTLPRAVLSDRS